MKKVSGKSKILITGAAGFTGLHSCRYFASAGYEVTAVTRSKDIAIDNVMVEQCDLHNKELVLNLIKKVKPQYLLHLAGQNHVGQSWSDPTGTLETNLLSTVYILDAIHKECPESKSVIVGSALQIDPSNISAITHPYSLSKTFQVLAARAWAELYGLSIVIAQPTNLIGPGNSNGVCSMFAKKIAEMESQKAEHILNVNNLYAQRDFIDVRDAVRAYEILLKNGVSKEIYPISSGKSRSLGEVVKIFKTMTPINFKVKISERSIREDKVKISSERINQLGWKPIISFKKSLEDNLKYYRRNPY
ncbi:NAD-dependent epimerase/dehydratase family protein [Cytobacillus pseudoceanisediminis]|uniref:NAD-dependent epimerase/dehydratase family protein n=1 Tax=Cytobacillus pseudoceanisediminis TaxID=3051614 RepID=UPI0021886ABB|nr:NAD-dependent epimerase/dehydratase family protein [Cytobacillus pseudoceanisediminis]UQX56686.1 NAD-dependent epimerase/dehydratase family protein [Cytobacillus pseudoceanisediminis]